MHITVKYGVIRILNTEADLCNYAKEADLSCPIKKGKLALSKVVELPKEIPPVSLVEGCVAFRCAFSGVRPLMERIADITSDVGNLHRTRRRVSQGPENAAHLLQRCRLLPHRLVNRRWYQHDNDVCKDCTGGVRTCRREVTMEFDHRR